jgi:hypothetical protein
MKLRLEHQYYTEKLIIKLTLTIPEHIMTDDLRIYRDSYGSNKHI